MSLFIHLSLYMDMTNSSHFIKIAHEDFQYIISYSFRLKFAVLPPEASKSRYKV